jgi:hypothetical protein
LKTIKIFIDGQNFYNRLKDYKLTVDHVNYKDFFDLIIQKIKSYPPINNKSLDPWGTIEFKLLKADWFTVGDTIVDHYPEHTMKLKHLRAHAPKKNGNTWRMSKNYSVNHPKVQKRYKKIFECEKIIDEIIVEKAKETIGNTQATIRKLAKKYKGEGMFINGEQLDLIYIKRCGFLKVDFETRTWNEKGIDTAIASQMIASNLDTLHLGDFDDDDDVIPDYNSDVIVLISTDMDFIEPIRFLNRIQTPTYMVHVVNRLSSHIKTKDICRNIQITKQEILDL